MTVILQVSETKMLHSRKYYTKFYITFYNFGLHALHQQKQIVPE